MSITYGVVSKICAQLAEEGNRQITTRMVRNHLGHGSLSTISTHLKTWRRQYVLGGDNVFPLSTPSKASNNKCLRNYKHVHPHPYPYSVQAKSLFSEFGTNHNLRIRDPIKYGELLVQMCEEGRTQKDIAEILSCNRQVVGRYQRVGRWPDEVKDIVRSNRSIFTNTKILAFASRAFSESELIEEVRTMAGKQKEPNNISKLNMADGFSDLKCQMEAIVARLSYLEGPCTRADCSNIYGDNLSWHKLATIAVGPVSVLLMVCITFLTSYLVYQGTIFFSDIDPVPLSAIGSAVVSELIPCLSAACFALTAKISSRLIAMAMLLTSILGLGVFMHDSLSNKILRGSGQYERLVENRRLTISTIAMHTATLDKLPESYLTKRQDLIAKIGEERKDLTRIDRGIAKLEANGGNFSNSGLGYSVWIRIAAMLLNAHLIHLFFSCFRRRGESAC